MKKLIYLILLLVALIVACQNLNSIEPPKELNALDRLGRFIDTTFYADTAFFEVKKYINTERSVALSVGSFQGFNLSSFLRFTNLPNDSGTIYDSIYVILTHRYRFPESGNNLSVMVSEMQEFWPDSLNILEKFHHYQGALPFYSFNLSTEDSGLVKIPISKELFERWLKAGSENFGIYIYAQQDQNGFIKEFNNFYSEDPETWPKLVYRAVHDTTITHDTLSVGIGSTVYDYDFTNPQNIFKKAQENNELILSSGIASRLVFRFSDLKNMPPNSIIYKADVLFDIDDSDFFEQGQKNRLANENHRGIYFLRWLSSVSEDGAVKVDSTFSNNRYYSYSLYEEENRIHFLTEGDQVRFGKGYIQGYLDGTYNSIWFYLHYINEKQDLSIKRVKSFTQKGVRLRVYYYLVKNEGF